MQRALQIRVTAFTDQGAVRPHNEDTIAVASWVRNAPMEEPKQTKHKIEDPILCLVADGMGGHAAGEEASRRAAMQLVNAVSDISDEAAMVSALRNINRHIFDAMHDHPELRGMGTTVAGMVLAGNGIIWFNVGDSRLYRYRDGFLRQLSVDDVPDPYAASEHRSHGITQSIGGASKFVEIAPHTGLEALQPGWRYLLCSDGLTDMISIELIEAAMLEEDLSAVQNLFGRAMESGGQDNISIIIVSIDETPSEGGLRKGMEDGQEDAL